MRQTWNQSESKYKNGSHFENDQRILVVLGISMRRLTMPFASILFFFLFILSSGQSVFVSNLDVTCLKCLCKASTGCNEESDCSDGFCGPFFISRKYWEDADSITLSTGGSSVDGGYRSCVENYECASQVVSNYMLLEGWDCNGDGVTDCEDYARIHYFGPERCGQSIESSLYYKRYKNCMPPKARNS